MRFSLLTTSSFTLSAYGTQPTRHDLVFPLIPVSDHVYGLTALTADGVSRTLRLETRTNDIFMSREDDGSVLTLPTANTGDQPVTIESASLHRMPLTSQTTVGILGLGRGSVFVNTLGSFMLLPEQSTGGARLIGSPENPAQYCFENQIAFVPTPSSKIEATVDLIFDNDLSHRNSRAGMFEFVIRTGIADDFVDPYIYHNIARIIESNPSRRIVSHGQQSLVEGCTEDLLNELPSLKYGIVPDGDFSISSDPVIDVVIAPEDYLELIAEGVCALRIQPRQNLNTLGMNFLSKLGVVFDYANRRLGFCDPL